MKAVSSECLSREHHRAHAIRVGLAEDMLRHFTKSPENRALKICVRTRLSALLTPELMALALYRVAHFLYVNGRWRIAFCITWLNFLINKVNITPQSCIGPGCRLAHPAGVTFHGSAGRGLTLYSLAVCCPDSSLNGAMASAPKLGDNVALGAHAVVIGSFCIGDGTRIAQAVRLASDAPAGVLVVSSSVRPRIRARSELPGQPSRPSGLAMESR